MCVCGPFMFTLKHNQKDVAVLPAGAQSVTVGGGGGDCGKTCDTVVE